MSIDCSEAKYFVLNEHIDDSLVHLVVLDSFGIFSDHVNPSFISHFEINCLFIYLFCLFVCFCARSYSSL